jgi:transmembrane sensor
MKTNPNIEEMLWRYFEGNAEKEDIEFISDWLDQSKENEQLFIYFKKTFIEISADAITGTDMVDKAYARFLNRVTNAQLKKQSEKRLYRKQLQMTIWRYASVIIFLLGLSFIFYFFTTKSGPSADSGYCEVQVPYGARSLITLPDGSKVWLNAGSKFKYNRNFDINSRDVYLEGEAYFDVEKRKHAFVVHTSDLDLRVLGTTFNVKAYPEEENIEATLIEGSIQIESKTARKPLFLKPKEKLTYHKPDMKLLISEEGEKAKSDPADTGKKLPETAKKLDAINISEDVNTEESTSWKDGKLIINNESLEDLTKKLERKYDITFTFDMERLKSYSYSGTLRDFPLEQILKALEITSPIRYVIKEKTVMLYYNPNFKPLKKNE